MKNLLIVVIIALCGWLFSAQQAAAQTDVTVTKLGKGGAVFQNGSCKLCPQFSFRKCCTITITWSTIWSWITDGGSWDPNVNSDLPISGNAEVYDDTGAVVGNYTVRITWINPNSCADVNGNSLIVEQQDMEVEVVN
ncbi:MAG: hypothetical protein KKA81_02805 [Bacteroidetes bacterium]|nr:hypothetical protein [Bacteroidota bacterium]